jgi:hypothetical protein
LFGGGGQRIVERQPEVEVYLRDCPVERVLAWVREAVGPLTGPFDCGGVVAYHPATGPGAVVVTPSVEGGPFLGVWFNTPARPWATDAECARAAARDLGCVARCDPSREHPELPPGADVWLEVSGGVERLVAWGQDAEPNAVPDPAE